MKNKIIQTTEFFLLKQKINKTIRTYKNLAASYLSANGDDLKNIFISTNVSEILLEIAGEINHLEKLIETSADKESAMIRQLRKDSNHLLNFLNCEIQDLQKLPSNQLKKKLWFRK